MIPLNKPGTFHFNEIGDVSVLTNRFPNYYCSILYSSRTGLNYIYQELYNKHGSLQVAVSPLTCFNALYPIVANGHSIVFVDINPETFNIDEDLLVNSEGIDVVQIIYLGGNPVNIKKISDWAQKKGVIIVEDCAQALGSTFDSRQLGSWGSYSVISAIKNLYSPAGGFLFSKEKLNMPTSPMPAILKAYKNIKLNLESKTSYSKHNLWNSLYEYLLRIKKEREDTYEVHSKIVSLSAHSEKKVVNLLEHCSEIEEKRLKVAKQIIEGIDFDKYFIQKEENHGHSNRNRIILLSKNKEAEDIVLNLRKNGIAANNLTQNYLNGFQQHVKKDPALRKFYVEKLPVYESTFPFLLSIPVSPFLSNDEISHIIKMTNMSN